MSPNNVVDQLSSEAMPIRERTIPNPSSGIGMGLLTGCQDRPYALELAMGLAARGVHVDVIGSDDIDSPELHNSPNLRFRNFSGSQDILLHVQIVLWMLFVHYAHMVSFAHRRKQKVLHILWNNTFEVFE